MESDISKVDVAHAKLKKLVTRYDLVAERHLRILPGAHLHIDELSDRVRVSATPVRQALERLHGEGLIDCIPKRGFFAKVPDVAELQDLYEFALMVLDRSILALHAPAEAGGFEPDLGAAMTPAPARSAEGHQHNATLIEGVSERITRLSRNGQMLRMIRNFNDRSHYVRCFSLAYCATPSIHLEEIVGLIDLIRTGQIGQARATLHAKMTHEITHLPEIIRHLRARWAEHEGAEGAYRLPQMASASARQVLPGQGKKSFRQL
jgi:DNA-binding GntR family transcriptional regulator